MKKLFIVVSFVILPIISQAGARFFANTKDKYAPISERRLSMLARTPSIGDAIKVGTISVDSKNVEHAIRSAKKLAAKHGGDTLYIITAKDVAKGLPVGDRFRTHDNRGNYNFVVYRFRTDDVARRNLFLEQ